MYNGKLVFCSLTEPNPVRDIASHAMPCLSVHMLKLGSDFQSLCTK